MIQDLPSGVDGYSINIGQTKKGFDIFICDRNGVPVVVVEKMKAASEDEVYSAAKEMTKKYYDDKVI